MSDLTTLLPILFVLVPILLPSNWRYRGFIASPAVLLALAALIFDAREMPRAVALFTATTSNLPLLAIRLYFDPLNLVFSMVVLIALLTWMLMANLRAERMPARGVFVLAAGALAFLLAGNYFTLYLAWMVVDAGVWLVARACSEHARWWRIGAVSQIGALVFLAAMMLTGATGDKMLTESGIVTGLAATLLLIAAWVRAGAWPFHLILPVEDSPAPERAPWVWGTLGLLGAYLLVRALDLVQGPLRGQEWLVVGAIVGWLATALLAWRSDRVGENLIWIWLNTFGAVLLAAWVEESARAGLIFWLAVGGFSALVLIQAAHLLQPYTRRAPWRQVLWFAGIGALAGLPLTPAFWGRVSFYALAWRQGDGLILLAGFVLTTLALAPLVPLGVAVASGDPRRPSVFEYAGIFIALVVFLGAGVAAFAIAPFLGADAAKVLAFAGNVVVQPRDGVETGAVLAAIILPAPLAFYFGRAWASLRVRLDVWPERVGGLLALEWFFGWGGRGLMALSAGARRVVDLVEQHPLAWLLLFALWLALWVLKPGT